MTDSVYRQSPGCSKLHITLVGCLVCLFSCLSCQQVFAEEEMLYDEVPVLVNVTGLGSIELDALIKEDQVYLPVSGLFDYLKINGRLSENNETMSGFFLHENNLYEIDKSKSHVIFAEKTYPLDPEDIIRTLNGLYLRSEFFGNVFGLHCVFNFRTLSVNLNTKLELPAIREKRQEMARNNLSRLKKETKADTSISRRYPGLHLGNVDWSLATARHKDIQDSWLNLRLGGIIAGGETNVALNYDTRQSFSPKRQTYHWRFVDNEREALRQIKAGKIAVQSSASLLAPVLGLQLTNTPTSYRRSFGTYTISDFTEPEWLVELYINNVLIDYGRSDASGFFTFEVPMIYGTTTIQLRFFGPGGEERFKEKDIHVPYTFLPKNELEYTLSAGILEDGEQSLFSRLDIRYGAGNRITVGGGVEYLSALNSRPMMPFINASFRLGSAMLLSADYTYGVQGKAALNYRMPGDLLVELNYVRYHRDQQAVWQNFLEEYKAMISRPFRTSLISGFSRLSLNRVIYPNTQQFTADLLMSASMKGISANVSTYAQMTGSDHLNVYSNMAVAVRLNPRLTFRPLIQYSYKFRTINEVSVEMEKQMSKRFFFNFSYQKNFNYNSRAVNIGLRYDLSFARTSFSARQDKRGVVFSQSLSGGAIMDAKTKYFNLNNSNNVGKGGLVIYPFLDLNMNNRRDKNEPKIPGLELKIAGGRVERSVRDTSIRVFDLEPYGNYLVELSRSSFDNIAWQLKKVALQVTAEPNKLKLIEVPVTVGGEATGMVYSTASELNGQGRIIVNFYRDGTFIQGTLSESDGYFSFLGLAPGAYTAAVDPAQLSKLKMKTIPETVAFTIVQSAEGNVAGNLDFKLCYADSKIAGPGQPLSQKYEQVVEDTRQDISNPNLNSETTSSPTALKKLPPAAKEGNGDKNAADAGAGNVGGKEDINSFRIRVAAIGNKAAAQGLQSNLARQYGYPVSIYFEGSNAYQLNVGGFQSRSAAEAFLPVLGSHHLKDARVIAPAVSERSGLRYGLVAGEARHAEGLQSIGEFISGTLQRPFFTVEDSAGYHLLIPGYADRRTAEQDHRRLLDAGVPGGHIYPYREQQVKVYQGGTHAGRPDTAGQGDGGAAAAKSPTIAQAPVARDSAAAPLLRYRVVAGEAHNAESIAAGMALIERTLGVSAFAVKENGITRFHISGFKDPETAEAARRKLLAAGLSQGYIASYRLIEVPLEEAQ